MSTFLENAKMERIKFFSKTNENTALKDLAEDS